MAAPEYGRLSIWRDMARIDATEARDRASRLELRAKADDEKRARDEYLSLLGVKPGECVLDVGCGSGVVLREIARRVAPHGRAVGVDPSAAMLEIAGELAANDALSPSIELHAGDCRALPFADGVFDATIAATVLTHVDGAERALDEMVRVTRAGGRVGIFDFDGDSLLVSHDDRALTRRIVAAFSDTTAVNGWLMRAIPGLLAARGVGEIQVRAFMTLERDADSFSAGLTERAADVAHRAGGISADERDRWLAVVRADRAAGRFMGGRVHLFAWGVKK
jgi:ubiquinone/menaquinone biosynthesis C-methylase UbiE